MHSVKSSISIRMGLLCLGLGLSVLSAATRKSTTAGKTSSADHGGSRAPVETVYVANTSTGPASLNSSAPQNSSAPLFGGSAGSQTREAEERRTRTVFAIPTGPTRDFDQAFGLYGGFYNTEVLGSNPYANAFWDLYPGEQPYYFEFTGGVGTSQSSFSNSVVGGGLFPHNIMLTTEALGGYTLSGLKNGAGRAGGLFPYFVAGIALIYQGGLPFQGGVPNIGGVLGFGNRMNIPYGPKDGRWALNYGLRDHVYSQKIRTKPSMTQNFILLIGVQKYY